MGDVVEQPVTFPAAGRAAPMLRGMLARPSGPSEAPRTPVVLCHPQPISSSMDDPLTARMSQDVARAGLLALRFNFRGVAGSEGDGTDGRLEPLDIAGACEFALAQAEASGGARDGGKVALVGNAFGATMALTYAAHDPRVGAVVAIGLPVFRITPDLGRIDRPILFVTGEFDEVSPPHKLQEWIQQLPGPCGLRIVAGARHLMRDHVAVASSTVTTFLTRWAATAVPSGA